MSNDARNEMKVFSMGAAILLVFATELLVAYHYFTTLSGWSRAALIGLAIVAWVIFWSTRWASNPMGDVRVKYTAFIVATAVSGIMVFNGAMVIADMTLERRIERADKSAIARMEARGKMNAELKKAGGTWRDIQAAAQAEKNDRSLAAQLDNPDQDEIDWYKWVKGYMSLYIFLVPILAAVLGKATLLGVIMLPGGASGFLPSSTPSRPSGMGFGGPGGGLGSRFGGAAGGSSPLSSPASQSDEPSATRGNGGGIGFASSTLGGGSARGQWGGGAFGGDSREGSVPKGIRPR